MAINYTIGDINLMRKTLLSGKTAIVKEIAKFSLKEHDSIGPYLEFIVNKDLKNLVWNHFYHNEEPDWEKLSPLVNQLLKSKRIDFTGFGTLIIAFRPPYTKWDDFHGNTYVDKKPYLKFDLDEDFADSLYKDLDTSKV